jgi:hypothetical protein
MGQCMLWKERAVVERMQDFEVAYNTGHRILEQKRVEIEVYKKTVKHERGLVVLAKRNGDLPSAASHLRKSKTAANKLVYMHKVVTNIEECQDSMQSRTGSTEMVDYLTQVNSYIRKTNVNPDLIVDTVDDLREANNAVAETEELLSETFEPVVVSDNELMAELDALVASDEDDVLVDRMQSLPMSSQSSEISPPYTTGAGMYQPNIDEDVAYNVMF